MFACSKYFGINYLKIRFCLVLKMTPASYFTASGEHARASNIVTRSISDKTSTVPMAQGSGFEIDLSTVNTSFSPNTGCVVLGKLLHFSPSISSSANVDAKVLPHRH